MVLFDGVETVILAEDIFSTGPFEELHRALCRLHLLYHNGLFDAAVLGWALTGMNSPLPIHEDTMLLHYCLNPGRGVRHALKIVGPSYLGIEDWGLAFGKVYDENGAEVYVDARSYEEKDLHRYCALDGQNTRDLFQDLKEWAVTTQPEQWRAYKGVLLPAASELLVHMRSVGISTDVQYAQEKLVDYLQQDVMRYEMRLAKWGDKFCPGYEWPRRKALGSIYRKPVWYRSFNPSSPSQVKHVLHSRGARVESTDKKTLDKLNERALGQDGFLNDLLGFRAQSKVLGTYALPIAERSTRNHPYENYRLFPVYKLHGTQTGRLSSENPNIQNQPKTKEVRRAYIPRSEGRVLTQSDYGQAELRVMAAISMDPWLLSMFNDSDEDLFNQMMPTFFPDVDFSTATKDEISNKRRDLKACVPLDTMILTKRGWLRHDEVQVGDETPGLDGRNRTTWTKITAVHHPGRQKVYRFGHSSWGFRVTEDHRWSVGKRVRGLPFGYSEPVFRETKDIKRNDCLYVAGELDDDGQEFITDQEVKLLAWVYYSPSHRKPYMPYRVEASGSRIPKLEAVMKEAGVACTECLEYSDTYKSFTMNTSHVVSLMERSGLNACTMEQFLIRLPRRQRHLWLEAAWDARGYWNAGTRGLRVRQSMVDTTVLAASLCGRRTSVREAKKETKEGYLVSLLGREHVTMQTAGLDYLGMEEVWCVTTELGTWTARQDHTVAVTGNCVYGLAYDRGAAAIATQLKVPVKYSQWIIDTFLGNAAGLNRWRQGVIRTSRASEPLVTRFGRFFQAPPVFTRDIYPKGVGEIKGNAHNIQRSALSFLPQSSASDCCLLAAVEIAKEIRQRNLDWEIVALVHDAITMDIPEEDVEEAEEVQSRHMLAVAKKWFPEVRFTVDAKSGTSWDQT